MKSVVPDKTKKWKEYEDAVSHEYERIFYSQDVEIIRNIYIVGRISGVKRQIDVLIRLFKDSCVVSTCIVECKNYSKKVNVKIVDSFVGFLEDVGADKGIIVSEKGFSKAAINRAHNGNVNIEVDILSLGELQQFQNYCAIPYNGSNALLIAPPFGWIVDCKQYINAPAILYRRGLSFEDATGVEKEWMYLQYWSKESEYDTLENLIESQNNQLKDIDEHAELRISEIDGLVIREAYLCTYPTPEVTVFRDFEGFIAFVVLFCPMSCIKRDTKKAISLLNRAIPIIVNSDVM